MFGRRRRPLLRAAAVGGAAYYAGKKVQGGREEEDAQNEGDEYSDGELDADQSSGAISDESIDQLKKLSDLKEQGVLTQEEFEAQKHKILGT